ncbi:MAG: hypothetical protein MUF87_05190 [Anaerolineae bacterium]|jgi:hypothetical protein|nr:hypothetical protein [Anaerolineae bacterium]
MKLLERIDRSTFLSKLLDRLSDIIAKRRGLPVIAGIGFVILALIVQIIDVFVGSQFLELIGVLALHIGILTALIGLSLATPIGR